MTVSDYIRQRFQSFGIQLSEADLLDMCLGSKISGEGEMDGDIHDRVSVAIVRFIPSLLLRATSRSVSENGHSKSQSWDIQGMRDFYSFGCKKHGLKDELNKKATATFLQ